MKLSKQFLLENNILKTNYSVNRKIEKIPLTNVDKQIVNSAISNYNSLWSEFDLRGTYHNTKLNFVFSGKAVIYDLRADGKPVSLIIYNAYPYVERFGDDGINGFIPVPKNWEDYVYNILFDFIVIDDENKKYLFNEYLEKLKQENNLSQKYSSLKISDILYDINSQLYSLFEEDYIKEAKSNK